MRTVNAQTIAHAVNVANSLREAFGEEKIDDLPPSMPGKPRDCVLAKAFNFDCVIATAANDNWKAYFGKSGEAQAKKLAEMLPSTLKILHNGFAVELPQEIGEIAIVFDRGGLDAKYYQDPQEKDHRKEFYKSVE